MRPEPAAARAWAAQGLRNRPPGYPCTTTARQHRELQSSRVSAVPGGGGQRVSVAKLALSSRRACSSSSRPG